MSDCMHAPGGAPDQACQAEWREPPGYLGEAVRRAKRIPAKPATPPAAPPP